MLVGLFNCHFMEGRSAAAPKMRQEASAKTTMADLEKPTLGVASMDTFRLPHCELSAAQLDDIHPALQVPADGRTSWTIKINY